LYSLFSFSSKSNRNSYGSINSSKAIIDQKSGECKGYGFAMFDNEQECEEAIEGLNKDGLQASFARVGQVSIFITSRIYFIRQY
jgi:RNA recognition motif-containing protein